MRAVFDVTAKNFRADVVDGRGSSGRGVVLGGPVAAGEDARRVLETLAAVSGVRAGVVGCVARSGAGSVTAREDCDIRVIQDGNWSIRWKAQGDARCARCSID